ncbi:hypothetical protein A2943_00395 [Candidatus Adlerbacteria bacterium RIFCSPLOWO2_01_FULL_51_16]|uniref:Uncharacterized protein n=1 Tax=Candidatus Adlerbacteria bacterium RIFCSPLOWO2_01_FULL_51_16 TaxID=1797243 RepID=A0A1F4XFL3_9BACT|nr:MAG: hypothetical protein A2943_00395 [Candidatus Adlerbacteria bacterium RIFCSPLOWO2_01_FULL_51_16]
MIDLAIAKIMVLATTFARIESGGGGGSSGGDSCGGGSFFGFPHWWQYTGSCGDLDFSGGNLTPLWGIILALVEILLRVAGIVAVVYIMIAGISYILSRGNTEKTAASRTKIINALIGLAIAVIGASLVSFIGRQLGG